LRARTHWKSQLRLGSTPTHTPRFLLRVFRHMRSVVHLRAKSTDHDRDTGSCPLNENSAVLQGKKNAISLIYAVSIASPSSKHATKGSGWDARVFVAIDVEDGKHVDLHLVDKLRDLVVATKQSQQRLEHVHHLRDLVRRGSLTER
jgi:hypothetical protein